MREGATKASTLDHERAKERPVDPAALRESVQRVMTADCGVVRDAAGLKLAADTLVDLARLVEELPGRSLATYEASNLVRVSQATVAAAAAREESRGAHTRVDFPKPSSDFLGRLVLRGDAPPQFATLPPSPRSRRSGRSR